MVDHSRITQLTETASATASVHGRPTEATPPTSGQPTNTRYLLGEEIARGGMGEVYRATDTVFGRQVAVKVLQKKYGLRTLTARRFAVEARITGQLQHPAIPPVHDHGTLADGRSFLVMKLIKGETLEARLKKRTDLVAERGADVAAFELICLAVAYAHAHGVIHRDLKPANVMIGAYGEVQVMDWGLAKVLDPSQTLADPEATACPTEIGDLGLGEESFTQAGSVMGTPAYMPPEQAIGAIDQIDTRSDVFGLGGILAVILTGQPPFVADTTEGTRQQSAKGKVQHCFERLERSSADPELVALCKRCLAADQCYRPADAGVVAALVTRYRAAAEERARQAELERVRVEGDRKADELRAAEQRRRRRLRLALAGMMAVLVIAGGAFAWHSDRQALVERGRRERNAEGVAALLDQAEQAIRRSDAAKARMALDAASERAAEGGTERLAERIVTLRADASVLEDLDRADQYRWRLFDTPQPTLASVAARYREVLVKFGADPNGLPPAEVAARVTTSAARDRLVAALDYVLRGEKSMHVLAVLKLTDPDPFRDVMRDAIRSANARRVGQLANLPEAAEQPSAFLVFVAMQSEVSPARKQSLLIAAVKRQPSDVGTLLALGWPNSLQFPAKADECLRWLQAAVAVAPTNAAAHHLLGVAIEGKGDVAAAVQEYAEACRLDPSNKQYRYRLRHVLLFLGDLDAAEAIDQEGVRVAPEEVHPLRFLAQTFQMKGDRAREIDCYRRALQIDPKSLEVLLSLGETLRDLGDLDGAVESFQKAVRFAPDNAYSLTQLRATKRMQELLDRLPGIVAGTARPNSPAEACEFADLCAQAFLKRFGTSIRLYETAFAADPTLTDPNTGRRFAAARAAARTAHGDDNWSPLEGKELVAIREKALRWLRADLEFWKTSTMSAAVGVRQTVVNAMLLWLQEKDLSTLRTGLSRIHLSKTERDDWDGFWAEVAAILAEARKSPPPVK